MLCNHSNEERMTMKLRLSAVLFAMLAAAPVWAGGVKIENAWVRATAPGQPVAAAFMQLTADADMTLLSASSPSCKVTELHTMSMEDGVMIMRPMPKIDLPKGKTVQLKPGGLHVMLIDLNAPIQVGTQVPITLVVQDAKGQTKSLAIKAPAMQAGMTGPMHHH